MLELEINTSHREEIIDITSKIQNLINKSSFEDGICVVFSSHTTAGITINESADPNVKTDLLEGLKKLAPLHNNYKHIEGNSDSHIKTSLIGQSVTVIVEKKQLQLGTWQSIWFCEFDGPRKRRVWVKLI